MSCCIWCNGCAKADAEAVWRIGVTEEHRCAAASTGVDVVVRAAYELG